MSAHGRSHWIKLYVEMVDDPKVGLLPDAIKWRWVSVLLLAGEINEDGYLPDVNDMAWRLHTNVETLQGEMRTMAGRGLVELREYDDGSERWFIPAFAKRQEAATSTERSRMMRHKQRQNSNDDSGGIGRNVAKSSHNTETEYRIQNTETEGEPSRTRARLHPATAALMASPLPPPAIRYEPRDRTPDGFKSANGYHPPEEPEPPQPDPAQVQAIGDMTNAITDVTGVSGRLNWQSVSELAEDLHRAGYTAAQVRAAYSRQATAGAWHWYAANWKGKKGDPPTLKDIRETIAGATARAAPTKKPGPIERALAMLGNPPPPDPAIV